MAGATKADFDDAYQVYIERYLPGGYRPTDGPRIYLHYNHYVMAPRFARYWANIITALNLTASDVVLVVGCGFGWGVEALQLALPGITAIGIDISDYVEAEKGNSEEQDLIDQMTAKGRNIDDARGLELRALARAQRTPNTVTIEKEDLFSNQSRNRVRQALGNQWPTHMVTEDMIQTLDEAELSQWISEASNVPSTIVHAVGGMSSSSYTEQTMATRTGHMVLNMNSGEIFNP